MNYKKLLGLGIASVIFILFIRSVGISELLTAISQVEVVWIAIACVSVIITFIFRGRIWYGVFRSAGADISVWQATKIQFIGWATKLLVPAGYVAIQPVIAKKLSEETYFETEKILSFITVGDILNFAPLYTFTLVGAILLSLGGTLPQTIVTYLLISVILAFSMSIIVFFALYKREVTKRAVLFGLRKLNILITKIPWRKSHRYRVSIESFEERILNAYNSVDVLIGKRKTLTILFVISHIGVFFYILILHAVIVSFGIQASFFVAVLLVLISKIGLIVPLPGGLGGVEAIIFGGLLLLTNGSTVEITMIVLIYRLLTYWVVIFIGSVYSSDLY